MKLEKEQLEITLDRGNRLAFSLTYSEAVTGTDLDMESYGPFTCEVRHATRTTLIVTGTATASGATLSISFEAADTKPLELTGQSPHIWGVRDAQGELWMSGACNVIGSPTEIP